MPREHPHNGRLSRQALMIRTSILLLTGIAIWSLSDLGLRLIVGDQVLAVVGASILLAGYLLLWLISYLMFSGGRLMPADLLDGEELWSSFFAERIVPRFPRRTTRLLRWLLPLTAFGQLVALIGRSPGGPLSRHDLISGFLYISTYRLVFCTTRLNDKSTRGTFSLLHPAISQCHLATLDSPHSLCVRIATKTREERFRLRDADRCLNQIQRAVILAVQSTRRTKIVESYLNRHGITTKGGPHVVQTALDREIRRLLQRHRPMSPTDQNVLENLIDIKSTLNCDV